MSQRSPQTRGAARADLADGAGPSSAHASPAGGAHSDDAFGSPRSASAKRARYAQRTSLSTGAGGTELVVVRHVFSSSRHRTPDVAQPQTPHLQAEADDDDEVDAGGAGAAADVDDSGDEADAHADASADAAALGGEASPVPFDAAMAQLRRRLLRGEGDVELGPKLARNYSQLLTMFEDTLRGSQNNSILLLGPRGAGKTLVLRRALAALAERHGDTVVPVRLSGLLHADERTALREVARQLGAPPAPEPDDEPDEGAAAAADGAADASDPATVLAAAAAAKRASVADNMAAMAGHLRSLESSKRAAVFILEEFDLFAGGQAGGRQKQMLLYNLMDALQACSVRAAVVGVSARTDAAELLEKRVRSRFSHRRLVFEPEGGAELLARLLRLPESGAAPHAAFAVRWNAGLTSALADPRAQAALADAAAFDRAPRAACAAAALALSQLKRASAVCVTPEALCFGCAALHRDGLAEQLAGCTVCELHLLVACKRLQRLRERPTLNFAAVFDEAERTAAALGAPAFPRDVALHAFEALVALGVLEAADAAAQPGGRTGGWLKEYAAYTLLLADAEAEQAVRQHRQAPTGLVDLLRHEVIGATGSVLD